MMRSNVWLFSVLFMHATAVFAEADHSGMVHHEHRQETSRGMLTEAGNDIFGTIQEVIAILNSDPDTDWEKVDIEALRQHLLDMHDMTINVDVISQKPVSAGMEAIIMPTTGRAVSALARVFKAHPVQLKRETGWDMTVMESDGRYIMSVISADPGDVSKIRGLGYIGLMAYGRHHQVHHWAMARGDHPHDSHN